MVWGSLPHAAHELNTTSRDHSAQMLLAQQVFA